MGDAYIELLGITKSFGPVVANKNINFSIRKGEIHAILGENGSGKSTLMNMLSGIYQPDGGSILINGQKKVFHDPKDSINAKIGMVHQHFKLIDVLTAKENIILGRRGTAFVRGKKLTEEIYEIEKKYGLIVNPDKKIYKMSVSEKQTVEILKVLYRGADVLILDEPTAVLTPQEIKNLFSILRNMKEEGNCVVIITHKLNEVLEISDRVTVLRRGESIKTLETKNTNVRELTELMVGRPISLEIERPEVPEEKKTTLLQVRDLTVSGENQTTPVCGLTFSLTAGEILGVAGIAGSGQKELCEAIAGLIRPKSGTINFKGEDITVLTPREIIKRGISLSFIPEDRLGMGLVGEMNIVDNVLLKTYRDTEGVFIDRENGRKKAEHIIKKFDIQTPSVFHEVKKLSGGNIQKVLLGREIDLDPELIITAYPVRGLDIGASYNIYDVLNEQKKKGVGILFIGEDLDVLLSICDRVLILSAGQNMGIADAKTATKEQVGLLMLGHKAGGGQ